MVEPSSGCFESFQILLSEHLSKLYIVHCTTNALHVTPILATSSDLVPCLQYKAPFCLFSKLPKNQVSAVSWFSIRFPYQWIQLPLNHMVCLILPNSTLFAFWTIYLLSTYKYKRQNRAICLQNLCKTLSALFYKFKASRARTSQQCARFLNWHWLLYTQACKDQGLKDQGSRTKD